MTTAKEFSWDVPRACPPWCAVEDHLKSRLSNGSDDYWHEGVAALFLRDSALGDSHDAEIRLSQHVRVDERGENTLRAEVTIDSRGPFSPADARMVAETILEWANRAEADTEWRRYHGFAIGPLLDSDG